MATENINIQLLIDTASSAKNLGQLKTSLKDLKKAYDSVEFGSDAFNKLSDAIDETVERTRTLKNGVDNIKQFEAAGAVLTNTFALATSSLAAFGAENEDVQKSILKVQAALGIAQSFSALSDAIGKARAAGVALNLTLLANPYVLVAAAVAGLALTFSNLNEVTTVSKKELADYGKQLGLTSEEIDKAYNKYKEREIKPLTFESFKFNKEELKNYNDELARTELLSISIAKQTKIINDEYQKRNEEVQKTQQNIDIQAINVASERSIVLLQNQIKLNEVRLQNEENITKQFQIRKENSQLEIDIQNQLIQSANKILDIQYNGNALREIGEQKLLETIKFTDESIVKNNENIKNIKLNIQEVSKQIIAAKQNDDEQLAKSFEKQKIQLETALADFELIRTDNINNVNDLKAAYDSLVNATNQIKNSELEIGLIRAKQIEDGKAYLNARKQEIVEIQKMVPTELKAVSDFNKEYNDLLAKQNDELEKLTKTNATIDDIYTKQLIDINQRIILVGNEINQLEKRNDLSKEEEQNLIRLKNLYNDLLTAKGEVQNKLNIGAEDFKTFWKETGNEIQRVGSIITQTSALITQAINQASESRVTTLENEKAASLKVLEGQYNDQLVAKETYEAEKKNIEDEYDRKIRDQKKKAFVAQKAASIIQATISGALAAINAFNSGLEAGGPTGMAIGAAFAAITAGLTAAQIGLIAAQPVPEFATGGVFTAANGGMVSGMGNGTSDNVNARLSTGESVINARSTAAFAPLLSAINQIGGGVSFNDSMKITPTPMGVKTDNKTETTSNQLSVNVKISEREITESQTKIKKINTRTTF